MCIANAMNKTKPCSSNGVHVHMRCGVSVYVVNLHGLLSKVSCCYGQIHVCAQNACLHMLQHKQAYPSHHPTCTHSCTVYTLQLYVTSCSNKIYTFS